MTILYLLFVLTWCWRLAFTQAPPLPPDYSVAGTSFLDHSSYIQGYSGQTFLLNNIPFIDIPDSNIQDVYYFRWYSLSHHLVYTTQGTGYIITEFVQPIGYAGSFDTVDAAAGHQIEEAQWLRSSFYAQDDIQIWTRGPGNSYQYTNWILYAAESTANVTGDQDFLNSQLDGMLRMWHLWDDVYDSTAGLYYWTPDFDAQEYSLPGYISDAASGNDNSTLQYVGPETYRPSHNAYMVASAQAIANVASAVGNTSLASQFSSLADSITQAMYSNLWNEDQAFFIDVIEPGYPASGPVTGREEVGFFPFRFGVGLESQYMNPTLAALFDPSSFYVPYGPPTLEVQNQYYNASKDDPGYCCFWNGQSWPYSTAHALKSLAAIYRSGNSNLTLDQYYNMMSIYATTQHKNGAPWIAESHYPTTDAWSQDATNHSEFYQHSTNNDIVITGLLGVIPRADNTFELDPLIPSNWTYFALENLPYHGNLITVLYDQDGSKYNQGSGLTIFCNGQSIYNGQALQAQVTLPSSAVTPSSEPIDVNIAANPYALDGFDSWPRASATYTWQDDAPGKAIDGFLFYDETPDNRWTNYQTGTARANDTLTIELARPRNLTGVALAIFQDSGSPNGAVACPASITITDDNGNVLASVSDFASTCLANDINVVKFTQGTVETSVVNMNFFGQQGLSVGM